MDKVFEKITLYDILGYGFPGIFMMSIMYALFYKMVPSSVYDAMKDNDIIVLVMMIIFGHITGLLLSELSKTKMLKHFFSGNQSDRLKKYGDYVINKSLGRSGLSTLKNWSDEDKENYMYSIVQVDQAFSRIHCYSSAEVMSRNASIACFLGCFAVFFRPFIYGYNQSITSLSCFKHLLALFLLFCGFIFLKERSKRFAKKKKDYAVKWFIMKYLGTDSPTNTGYKEH